MALLPAQVMDTASTPAIEERTEDPAKRRLRARGALKLADQLLNQLELLALNGRREVPDSLQALITNAQAAAAAVGVRRPALDPGASVLPLMDLVYSVEDHLLPQCRVRPFPPVHASH